MKKILLIVSVLLLVGSMLVVSCSAVTYQFKVDEVALGFRDVSSAYGDLEATVTYLFDGDLIDLAGNVKIVKAVVQNSAVDDSWTVTLYDQYGVYSFVDLPDLQSYGVTVIAEGDVSYDVAIDYFEYAFSVSGGSIHKVNIMDSLLPNISSVLSWIPGIFIGLIAIFWTGSALTPLGYLAVAGLSISVILLIVYLISRFLKFRG